MTSYQPAPNLTYALDDEAWWVQRWVELLNTYRFKKRLERGRIYAREGHILSLEYKGSKVTALVQGTAEEPYKLSIWLDAFSDEDWDYVIDSLSEQAIYSAQLLAGDMPAEIEAIFTANGLSLYPFNLSEVHSKCSCPDPKNPCKHIAAVYYQLGDLFREDPFVLFRLRGRSRTSILEALRQRRQSLTTLSENSITESQANPAVESIAAVEDLKLQGFWTYEAPLDTELVVITPSETTVLDVLGKIPLPPEEAAIVMAHLREVYQATTQQAMMQALG
ncbi:SWIM zinc finger family protein [Nodosilinea sp. LEGE 07088]|uniref:SWIM zinc finger family protein n=1 Tax=Nodosilinea sp. LEGE 07088 TaxID=2777968 RepID=UPI00188292B9|nr:SWIM zinc finger family protein [Nodosilinea sp. LEGE 07088]MBE9136544.1 SWIM zinc finger family protein [Nodosilinea sp. LEGE 07088]